MQALAPEAVLAFKASLRSRQIDATATALIGERDYFLLSGARAVAVASLIDGKRTVHDIVQAARAHTSEPEALFTLQQLVAGGYVRSAPVAPPPGDEAAFWEGLGLCPDATARALAACPVAVQTVGSPAAVTWMREALAQAGMVVDESAALKVVVTDDYLRPELGDIDRSAARGGTPWYLVKPDGIGPLWGPLFWPGRGPCWECLAFWMRGNRPVEEFIRRSHPGSPAVARPAAKVEASARAACGLGALALARATAAAIASAGTAATGEDMSPSSSVYALDLASFRLAAHAVVKRPQCPACGDPGLMAALGTAAFELRAITVATGDDGGFRQWTPRTTFERFKHLISSETGAVTYVLPTPGRETALRAVYASAYLACPREGTVSPNAFSKACAGKGRSADQAKVSALCEALERYSGVYQGDEHRVRASRVDLGIRAIPPAALLLFSDAQYRARAERPARALDARVCVPEALEDDIRIDWTAAWSLTQNERRFVPLSYCFAHAPAHSGTAFCGPCGNGVAAGTCLEEALLQGVLELVERDAAAVWWYNRVARPAIDLASFGDRYFDELRDDYRRHGWHVWSLDLTHDLRIPTVVSLAHHAAADRFAVGFGCHLDAHLAIQRSLTELNQLFDPDGTARAPWNHGRLQHPNYLFPDPKSRPIDAGALPRAGAADLLSAIRDCQRRIEGAGLELIAVNKTRPDIGLCVVQAIVPGLRHFWPRLAPGRLYDVPCAMGWRDRAALEGEMNQVPLLV